MSEELNKKEIDQNFISLLFTFQHSAMLAMGKLSNPVSGKIERSLDQAKYAIDTLASLQIKTKGNLTSPEEEFLKNILQDLRLNYVYEVDQDKLNPTDDKSAEENKEEDSLINETTDKPTEDNK